MTSGRVRLLLTLHSVLCTVLCVTFKPRTGRHFMKSETYNLSALFTDPEQHNLQDLTGPWSYNDTSDISKYEDFDHSRLALFTDPEQHNLQDLTGPWSYNDTSDISKYENFDHSRLVLPAIQFEPPPVSGEDVPIISLPSSFSELPLFDQTLSTNVSVLLGDSTTLRCSVMNAMDLRVSWVRRRDWHILSSGTMTYTNDERFQVQHTEGSDNWDLDIHYVTRRDNGTYECQVATGSGILSHFYHLHVVVPTAFILGSGEYHIGEGSTISLVCIIENSPVAPQYVFWYHNEKEVNYNSPRGRVTITTEPGPKTHSRLIVNAASPADTGNYTCRAPNTDPDTIYVFVTKEGENTAAIQRQSGSAQKQPLSCLILVFTSFLLALNARL